MGSDPQSYLQYQYEREREEHLKEVIAVATRHGWNGVENSKVLHTFLDDRLTELEPEARR